MSCACYYNIEYNIEYNKSLKQKHYVDLTNIVHKIQIKMKTI